MERLIHSTWLAHPVSCCFPTLQDGHDQGECDPAAPGMALSHATRLSRPLADLTLAVGNTAAVCYEQPLPPIPPAYDLDVERSTHRSFVRSSISHLQRPSTSHRHTTWLSESRPLTGSLSRVGWRDGRSTSRRPTIGAPFEFRKVQSGCISPIRRGPAFRPLQLSIYLPGNELPELPSFWDDAVNEKVNVPLSYPAQALVKSRSDSMLLRYPSSTISIPRKPVATRASSLDASRFSRDSQYAFGNLSGPSRSGSMDHLRSKSFERRPSIATTRSAQDFVDALDPPLPQPSPALLRSNSIPDPGYAIYRKASEQSLRLRTHLEERQSLERHLPGCATIREEISPLSPRPTCTEPLSSISDCEDVAQVNTVPHHGQSAAQGRGWSRHDVNQDQSVLSQPRSSSGSSTLFNPDTPSLDGVRADTAASTNRPAVTSTISSTTQSSIRNRLSQWLSKALPALPTAETCQERSSTGSGFNDYSGPTAPNSPWSSPRSRPPMKQSPIPSYWTLGAWRRESNFDVERANSPAAAADVGVAF